MIEQRIREEMAIRKIAEMKQPVIYVCKVDFEKMEQHLIDTTIVPMEKNIKVSLETFSGYPIKEHPYLLEGMVLIIDEAVPFTKSFLTTDPFEASKLYLDDTLEVHNLNSLFGKNLKRLTLRPFRKAQLLKFKVDYYGKNEWEELHKQIQKEDTEAGHFDWTIYNLKGIAGDLIPKTKIITVNSFEYSNQLRIEHKMNMNLILDEELQELQDKYDDIIDIIEAYETSIYYADLINYFHNTPSNDPIDMAETMALAMKVQSDNINTIMGIKDEMASDPNFLEEVKNYPAAPDESLDIDHYKILKDKIQKLKEDESDQY